MVWRIHTDCQKLRLIPEKKIETTVVTEELLFVSIAPYTFTVTHLEKMARKKNLTGLPMHTAQHITKTHVSYAHIQLLDTMKSQF
jgi:hypothetical protein